MESDSEPLRLRGWRLLFLSAGLCYSLPKTCFPVLTVPTCCDHKMVLQPSPWGLESVLRVRWSQQNLHRFLDCHRADLLGESPPVFPLWLRGEPKGTEGELGTTTPSLLPVPQTTELSLPFFPPQAASCPLSLQVWTQALAPALLCSGLAASPP